MKTHIVGIAAAALLFCCVGPTRGQIAGSVFPDFEVGKTGHFLHSKTGYWKTRIVEIIDKETMLMMVGTRPPAFIVKGHPTKGLADDKIIELKGDWKVTTTRRYLGTTYYVVEPDHAPAVERKKQEARKAADEATRQAQAEAERAAKRLAQEEAARKAAVAKTERQAELNLNYAKKLLDKGESDKAKQRLREILKDYPGTKGAKEAQTLLKDVGE